MSTIDPTLIAASIAVGLTHDTTLTTDSKPILSLENTWFARSINTFTDLQAATSFTNIGVYVYRKNEDPLETIDSYKDHLFAIITYINENDYTTKVYRYQDFKEFLTSALTATAAAASATAALACSCLRAWGSVASSEKPCKPRAHGCC